MGEHEQKTISNNSVGRLSFRERLVRRIRGSDPVPPTEPGPIPRAEIDIFYGAHSNARDQRGFHRHLAGADIYIPELNGWSEYHEAEFNKISNGTLSPDQVRNKNEVYDEFKHAERKSLHKSGIPVAFVDLPREKAMELAKNQTAIEKITLYILFGQRGPNALSFRGLIDVARDNITKRAELHKKREDYMVDHLASVVRRVVENSPELTEKDAVQVRMRLGTIHTRVSHELKKRGYPVRRTFPNKPVVFTHVLEAQRAVVFEKQLDDTLVARSVFTQILSYINEKYNLGKDIRKRNIVNRQIVSAFSYEDIQSIIERYWQHGPTEQYGKFFAQEIMRTKDIRIPTTEAELNSFLGIEAKKPARDKRRRRK